MGKLGFIVTYSSHRAFEADHAAYISHGGMMLTCNEPEAPDQNSEIMIKLVVGAKTFDLPARAGHFIKNRGVMVSFDDESLDQQNAIDEWLLSDDFKYTVRAEPESSVKKPTVSRLMSAGDRYLPSSDDGGDDTEPKTLKPRGVNAPDEEAEVLRPEPGAEYIVYVVKYSTVGEYIEHTVTFAKDALLAVPIEDPEAQVNSSCQLRLTLPGHSVYNIWSIIEKVDSKHVYCRCQPNDDAYRRAVIHSETVHSKARLARETPQEREGIKVIRIVEHMPMEDPDRMPIRRRLARMGMDDKINLALSGDREERMALAMDSNKAIHHYLLKNARITLDEIAFMARLPSLNPDVLERIAEIPAYTQNPTIAKALVYNPRTPVLTAIRLLDRLPRPEVMNLAKRTNMNMRLVMAAKKKLERR